MRSCQHFKVSFLWLLPFTAHHPTHMPSLNRHQSVPATTVFHPSPTAVQDVSIAGAGTAGPVVPEDMRSNVAGLSVELVRRDPATGKWSEAGLLDQNVLHGDWPHALPAAAGSFPRCVGGPLQCGRRAARCPLLQAGQQNTRGAALCALHCDRS